MNDELKHYGTPRHSGRYPWGSGESPYQSLSSFVGHVRTLRKDGLTDKEIAAGFGITTTELKQRISRGVAEERAEKVAFATRLRDKGVSVSEIGRRMGINESSVRSLLDPTIQERKNITTTIANQLKNEVAEKKYLDIGAGTELHMGVTKTRLNTAISMLKEEGYQIQYVKVEQLGVPGNYTSIKVLTPPGVTYSELFKNRGQIQNVVGFSEDGGRSFLGLKPIRSVSSDRVKIVYAEDGGTFKDGVIELRRGVEDLDLGQARYAQVRIGVDGTHFMKGMAIYSDNLPPGVDILYNTTKKRGTPPEKVFKEMVDDLDNPFKSIVRQKTYIDKNGKEQLSSLNIIGATEGSGEEGSWNEWSKTLSAQFLSKQPRPLVKRQLDIAYDIKQEEFNEIMSLTNPVIKNKMLMAFSEDCDAAASHLKAAALPRQRTQVILPVNSLKDTEIYAPNFRNGEQVVLIRYPHGGKFEIPELIVNNRNKEAKSFMQNAADAVGINHKVAARLSGADFDGDTVLVIPNPPKVGIRTEPALKGLENFDPKEAYKGYDGMKVMSKKATQLYMGSVTNLITDMTIRGAPVTDITKAVKHSMVVIDAHKHELDYERSYRENQIALLKEKYQGGARAGASTIISQASAQTRIPEVKKEFKINPQTGAKELIPTKATYIDKKGNIIEKTTKTTKMATVDDAHKLSSGMPAEAVYAEHANQLKALANQARKETLKGEKQVYSPSANKTYAPEVESLDAKLSIALRNAPLERQAQTLANQVIREKILHNPDIDSEGIGKLKTQALTEARNRTGAGKQRIEITPKEWEAIQAGAISQSKLNQIINNTDLDNLKKLATPRTTLMLPPAKVKRIQTMLSIGYTPSEISDALSVPISTIQNVERSE